MALTKYRFGDLIKQRREKYSGNELLPICGVSQDGFIPPKQVDADTSIYNMFYRNDFVFNPARMELNSITFNNIFDKAICSSLYEIFYITRQDIVIPEYLNLFIKREEFARKCWFEAVGSARNYFRVPALSEFEIQLPSIPTQRKYVDIYNAILANQQSYERGLDDLKLAFDVLLDIQKDSSPTKLLGQIFQEINTQNVDGAFSNVQGINIDKQFMPSVANVTDVDLKKYKVVKKGQFAYSGMQTGRDECIRIALYTGDDPVIIPPAYAVLQVIDDEVLSEYIMMWFLRKESDRRGWFMSDASIRTNLDLPRFYEIEIPVPPLPEQKAIVEIYDTYITRRELNNVLKARLKDICPVLIKGSLEEEK